MSDKLNYKEPRKKRREDKLNVTTSGSPPKEAPPSPRMTNPSVIPAAPVPPPTDMPTPVLSTRLSSHKLLTKTKHTAGVLKVLKEMVRMQRDMLTDLKVLGGVFLIALEEKFIQRQGTSGGTIAGTLSAPDQRQKPTKPGRDSNPQSYYDMINSLRKLVERIITSNLAILLQMEGRFKAIKLGEYGCFVSDILMAVAEALKLYEGYPEASASLSFLIDDPKTKKEFNEVLAALSTHPETRSQPFRHFLKRPLDFLDKYFLLGKVLLIYTDDLETDYLALVSALEKMTFEIKKIKRQMQRQTYRTRMLALAPYLQGMFDKNIFAGNRELIHELSCWRMTDRGKNFKSSAWQKKSLQLFLFSDVILLTKKKKNQMIGASETSYEFVAALSLARTVFNVVDSVEHKGCFELREISLRDDKEDAFFTLSTDLPDRRDALLKLMNKTQFKLYTGHQQSVSDSRKEKLKKMKVELADVKGKLAKEKHKNKLLKAKVVEYKKTKLAMLTTKIDDATLKKRSASVGNRNANMKIEPLPMFPPFKEKAMNVPEGIEVKSFEPRGASPSTPQRRHKRAHSLGDSDDSDHGVTHNALMEKYGLVEFVRNEEWNPTQSKQQKQKQHLQLPQTEARKPRRSMEDPSPRKKFDTASPVKSTPQPKSSETKSLRETPPQIITTEGGGSGIRRVGSSDEKKTKKKKAKKKEKEGKDKKSKKKKQAQQEAPAVTVDGQGTLKQPRELLQRLGNIQKEKGGEGNARSEVQYWLV